MKIPKEHLFILSTGAICIGSGEKETDGTKTGLETDFIVGVAKKKPRVQVSTFEAIPRVVQGQKTDVIEVGRVLALNYTQTKVRPLIGGVSCGHGEVRAGTLGAIWKGIIYSCNHVMANCNNAQIGDLIYQPGKADGESEPIATLLDFVPIKFIEDNIKTHTISSAFLALLNYFASLIKHPIRFSAQSFSDGNLVDFARAVINENTTFKEQIFILGEIKSVVNEPKIGMNLWKVGRSTGQTQGIVKLIKTTVKIDYPSIHKTAIFIDQFATNCMGDRGDSGSIAVDNEDCPVGLLCAGSDKMTFFNCMTNIL